MRKEERREKRGGVESEERMEQREKGIREKRETESNVSRLRFFEQLLRFCFAAEKKSKLCRSLHKSFS